MIMTRCAIGLLGALLLLTSAGYAQNLPKPNSHAPSPDVCPDDLLRACSAAVDEVVAARKLIAAQESELKAARESIEAQKARVSLLAEQNGALQARAMELRAALDAERAARKEIESLVEKFRLRVADLEKDLAKARRRTKQAALGGFIGGILAGAAIGR